MLNIMPGIVTDLLKAVCEDGVVIFVRYRDIETGETTDYDPVYTNLSEAVENCTRLGTVQLELLNGEYVDDVFLL